MIYLLWFWSFSSLNFEVGEVPGPVMVKSLLSDSVCCRKKNYKLSAKYKKKWLSEITEEQATRAGQN